MAQPGVGALRVRRLAAVAAWALAVVGVLGPGLHALTEANRHQDAPNADLRQAMLDQPAAGATPSTAVEISSAFATATTALHKDHWYYSLRLSQPPGAPPREFLQATLKADGQTFPPLYLKQAITEGTEEGAILRWCVGTDPARHRTFDLVLEPAAVPAADGAAFADIQPGRERP